MEYRNQHLHEAGLRGKIKSFKNLLKKGYNKYRIYKDGKARLHNTVNKRHRTAIEYPTNQGAEIEKGDNDGWTALASAAENGHLDVTISLISQGAEVNKGDNDGWTALHMAAQEGHLDVMKYLISQGADVNKGDNDGWTALHSAAQEGHLDVLKYLISQGAEVTKGDNDGWTALHDAAFNGHLDVTISLISQGADVNKGDNVGATALHSAAFNGHLDVIKYLISQEADVNNGENEGTTAQHLAAFNGHLDVLKYLISQGAEVNKGYNDGWTALHSAAQEGHLDVMKYLISQGAEVNKGNNDGRTPLHNAAFNGHLDITQYLISQGADVNKGDNYGRNALHSAALDGQLDVLKYLISQGAEVTKGKNDGWTVLHRAAQKGHLDVLKYLISEGADVNEGDNDNRTALHIASQKGHLDVMKYLISQGADVNKGDNDCMTPLHHAVQNDYLNIVQVLLAGGARSDTEDIHGHTPLQLCSSLGYQSIADLFIDRSNYKLAQNDLTDIHLAIQHGYTSIIEKLVSEGADLNAQSTDGQTCLHEAIRLCYKSVNIVQKTDTLRKISDEYYKGELSPEKALVFYLLENGAKLDVRDKTGNLPIHYAKDEVIKQMILSRLPSLEEIQSYRDSGKGNALLNTETAGTSQALAWESDQGTTEAERNDFDNLPAKAQSDGTDSVEPIDHALGELTGLDFPRKIEAVQGPTGGQTMTQEPTSTIVQPLRDDTSSKNQDGEKVHWDLLTESPRELTLQDNEVVISCGIRFTTSGAKLSETFKVTLDHNAHFTNPRRAEIVFYTRNKDSTTFVRIPASTDGCPARCDVRSKDLDLYVDHCSDWWIVALITRYFVGKRVKCTPYVRPPVTKGFTHLLLLCIYDDLSDVIKKIKEEMKEYRKLYPPQPMFVEWRRGDINIELSDCSEENEEKISEKILGERDMYLVEGKQFSFKVKPLESGTSQRFLQFTLDQRKSSSYPTLIHFDFSYDAATTNVETTPAAGATICHMDAGPTQSEASDEQKVTDANILNLARLLTTNLWSPLHVALSIEYSVAEGIREKYREITEQYIHLLQTWKAASTRTKTDLNAILIKAGAGGLVDKYLV